MTGRRPRVSVVVPCYNYGDVLPGCIRSILDQDGVEVRVLIIDDCSTDGSADIARGLAAAEDRVEVRIHEVNRGHIATYNEGLLEWADREYTALVSADDLLTPGALRRAADVLGANPTVGFVYGHAAWWEDDKPLPAARVEPTGVTVWAGMEWLRIISRLGHTVISAPEVVVRTSVQQSIGGYRPELPHTADAEMWMRFAVHSDVAYIKGVDQAYYRIHGKKMSNGRVPLVDLHQRRAAYDTLFEDHGARIPDAERLRLSAARGMAKEALWRACRAYERRRTETTPIAELVDFAHTTYPDTPRLPEYWGLRWRQRLGPQVCPYLQPFIVSAVHRRVRSELWWRRWRRDGV